jgi:hypothetical protein
MTVQRVKLADLTSQNLQLFQEKYAGQDMDVAISTPSESVDLDKSMNENGFWAAVNLLDWSKSGNDDAVIEPVIQHLSRQSESDILTFFDLLSEKLYLLDGRIYMENAATDSSDLFLYARCATVANGQKKYESVLRKPSLFPKDRYFEAILDISERAWFRKTGKKLAHLPKYLYETGFNPNGWGADTITL